MPQVTVRLTPGNLRNLIKGWCDGEGCDIHFVIEGTYLTHEESSRVEQVKEIVVTFHENPTPEALSKIVGLSDGLES